MEGTARTRIQIFRLQLEPDPDVLLWVLHPFALARLTPERIDVRCNRASATPALTVTAHFSEVSDIEAAELLGRLLKMPKVRTAAVETVVTAAE